MTTPSRPLVTAESALNLVSESLALVRDVGLFAHSKAVALLPEEPRASYEDLLARAYSQISPSLEKSAEATKPYRAQAVDAGRYIWNLVESKTSPFIGSLVLDFERRYPSQSGKIGGSLADKLTLLFVLWLAVSFLMRRVRGMFCSSCKQNKSVGYPLGSKDVRTSFPGKKND